MRIFTSNISSVITAIFILLFTFQSHAFKNDGTRVENNHSAHENEFKVLLESKVLRVAMYKGNTPPFYYQEKIEGRIGELQGIDVEIIEGFARKLGLNVQFIRSETLDSAVDMVAEGKADVAIGKLSITFSRASKVLFTKPYIKLRKGLLVNRVKLHILQKKLGNLSKKEAIQQLSGKLGVIKDSSYVAFANQRFKQDNLEKMSLSSWDDIVNKVFDGEYIAAFRDEAEIKGVIANDRSLGIKLLTVVLEDDYDLKGIALPLNAHHLKALLDLHIDSLGLELTAHKILFDYESVMKQLNRYNGR